MKKPINLFFFKNISFFYLIIIIFMRQAGTKKKYIL